MVSHLFNIGGVTHKPKDPGSWILDHLGSSEKPTSILALCFVCMSNTISSGSPEAAAEDTESYENELVFLTLGDGDFSWSLDFGRFLASSTTFFEYNIRLIATGIDSLQTLSEKYRDSNYTIREMKRLNENSINALQVDVYHEVNAIIPPGSSISLMGKGHFVIFNHPHLGTENAELHAKFLSHLFYSVNKFWLSPSGLFYLTLANGQYERWNCSDAALRNGMDLVERAAFDSSPSIILNPAYEHRRHQSGKSFASRTSGSETYSFARRSDKEIRFLRNISLPWFSVSFGKDNDSNPSTQPSYVCSICAKAFSEHRSLKNHVASVHSPRKRQRVNLDNSDSHQSFFCDQCTINSTARHFSTFEALQDHQRAKHDGIHSGLSPDWMLSTSITSARNKSASHFEIYGKCEICMHVFDNSAEEQEHFKMFLPSDNSLQKDVFQCNFCERSFRQRRSKLQHENFCTLRQPITVCRKTSSPPQEMEKELHEY